MAEKSKRSELRVLAKEMAVHGGKIAVGGAAVALALVGWSSLQYEILKKPTLSDKAQQAIMERIRGDTIKDPFSADCDHLRKTVTFDMQIAAMGSKDEAIEANSLLRVMNARGCSTVEDAEQK